MSFISRFLHTLYRKSNLNAEMAEEMQAHLELQAAENERRGMSPEEARYAALRAFGGVEQVKERARDQRGIRWLEELFSDIRFAAPGIPERAITVAELPAAEKNQLSHRGQALRGLVAQLKREAR